MIMAEVTSPCDLHLDRKIRIKIRIGIGIRNDGRFPRKKGHYGTVLERYAEKLQLTVYTKGGERQTS